MERNSIRRVYVWQLPVRFYHWINALCVLALALTGYFIGSPLTWTSHVHPEASFGYWFGTIRFIHFVAAFVFFFNFVFRLYWGFVGNKYADWKNFIMYRKDQVKEAKDVLQVDILQRTHKPLPSIGHNALAGFTYFLTFLMFLFQAITGFGMYAAKAGVHLAADLLYFAARAFQDALDHAAPGAVHGVHDETLRFVGNHVGSYERAEVFEVTW